MTTYFRRICVLVLFIMSHRATSQDFDLGSWNILNIKYTHNAKWSFFAEAQLRSLKFYNNFHYYEYKGGINCKVHPSAQITIAAGSYQTYGENGNFALPKNNDEFRLWPQVLLSQSLGRLKVEQRYRAEMRFTSNGYRNRFRYRVGLQYPFGKTTNGYKPYLAGINTEIFFTDREPYFERNRMTLTLGYKPAAAVTLQVGYLHQFDYKINDETGRDFLQVGVYLDLKRKKSIAKPTNT